VISLWLFRKLVDAPTYITLFLCGAKFRAHCRPISCPEGLDIDEDIFGGPE
jgi:hypothetical protein